MSALSPSEGQTLLDDGCSENRWSARENSLFFPGTAASLVSLRGTLQFPNAVWVLFFPLTRPGLRGRSFVGLTLTINIRFLT